MARLDTHVVVWLYTGDIDLLSPSAAAAIEDSPPSISPVVELELTYLHEVGRLLVPARDVVDDLRGRVDLRTSTEALATIVAHAHALDWTRDPFDRLICADALAAGEALVSADRTIRANLAAATW